MISGTKGHGFLCFWRFFFRKFVFCRNNRKKPQKVVILLRKAEILIRKIVESLFILSQKSHQISFIRYDKYQKLWVNTLPNHILYLSILWKKSRYKRTYKYKGTSTSTGIYFTTVCRQWPCRLKTSNRIMALSTRKKATWSVCIAILVADPVWLWIIWFETILIWRNSLFGGMWPVEWDSGTRRRPSFQFK